MPDDFDPLDEIDETPTAAVVEVPAVATTPEMTLSSWLDAERIPLAHGRRLAQLHALTLESKGTAAKFAGLYSSMRKARI